MAESVSNLSHKPCPVKLRRDAARKVRSIGTRRSQSSPPDRR